MTHHVYMLLVTRFFVGAGNIPSASTHNCRACYKKSPSTLGGDPLYGLFLQDLITRTKYQGSSKQIRFGPSFRIQIPTTCFFFSVSFFPPFFFRSLSFLFPFFFSTSL
ncbi:unnamed protein product [Absidia cylindrospora]